MNIRTQLLLTHSKQNTRLISTYIGEDEERLAELMHCFFSNEYRVTQRAAMVVSDLFDRNSPLLAPYIEKMVLNLQNESIHVAVKRNTVRILQFVEIPENLESKLFDLCLQYVYDSKEPIAVKAFSMGILYNSCKKYPELSTEVIPLLEEELARTESTGVMSRGRKVLSQLKKL